jgi:hypothetical protein
MESVVEAPSSLAERTRDWMPMRFTKYWTGFAGASGP